MSPGTALWVRLIYATLGAVGLALLLAPEQPAATVPLPVAVAAGIASALLLFAAVTRRRPRALAPQPSGPVVVAKLVVLGVWALNEELIWRRVALGELLRAGTLVALAASTVGFAVAHRKRRLLHLATGGVFGGLYVMTGVLGASVAAHWGYNVLVGTQSRVVRGEVPPVITAELIGVTKRYGRVAALDNASFSVRRGEVVALIGPNGAGKSTALGLLLGLRHPLSGIARLFERDPRSLEARRRVGMTPQDAAFPGTLRARELIGLVRAHYPAPPPLGEVAERFEAVQLLDRQVGGFSGGERRRLALALAFAGGAELVVLDEPTTALDAPARQAAWDAIRQHAAGGGTVLLTTHHLDEADALATRVVALDRGRVVADAPVAALKSAAGLTRVSLDAPPRCVEGAEDVGGRSVIAAADGGAVVERLVRAGVPLAGLEVRPVTLAEALEQLPAVA